MIIGFIFFIFTIFIAIYLPGRFVLRFSNFSNTRTITTALSLALGFSLFVFSTYLLSWINLVFLYHFFVFLVFIKEAKKTYTEFKIHLELKKIFNFNLLIISIGLILGLYLTARSGILAEKGLIFYDVNVIDSVFHLSLITNLLHTFPPSNPGLIGVSLRGYNFFYDLFIANLIKLYGFNIFDIFFRYTPFFSLILLGVTSLAIAQFLKFSKYTTYFFLYLIFLGQSIKFVLQFFIGDKWFLYDSRINQSFANIVDPSILPSVAIFLCSLLLLFNAKRKQHYLLAALLFGILPTLKIYMAIIAFVALSVISFYFLLFKKSNNYLFTLITATLIAVIVYFPINFGVGGLELAPFLFYRQFIEGSSAFIDFKWPLKYAVYEQHNNILQIIRLYCIALALFFIPSLGVRLLSVLSIKNVFNKNFYGASNIFITVSILTSFLVPTFFMQSFEQFVIVQMLWIGYILLSIPTAVALGNLVKNSQKLFIVSFSIIILISLPDIHQKLYSYSTNPYVIDTNLVKISNFIKEKIPAKEKIAVVTKDYDLSYRAPLVAALSGHTTYFEPQPIEYPYTKELIHSRKKNIETLALSVETCNIENITSIVKDELQKYVSYVLLFNGSDCVSNFSAMEKIKKHGSFALYKIL